MCGGETTPMQPHKASAKPTGARSKDTCWIGPVLDWKDLAFSPYLQCSLDVGHPGKELPFGPGLCSQPIAEGAAS